MTKAEILKYLRQKKLDWETEMEGTTLEELRYSEGACVALHGVIKHLEKEMNND